MNVANETILLDFSQPCSCINLQADWINFKEPDLLLEYEPWFEEQTFFGSEKAIPYLNFKHVSVVSARATIKCSPQKYSFTLKYLLFSDLLRSFAKI